MDDNKHISISPPGVVKLAYRNAGTEERSVGHAFPDLTRYQDRFYLAFRIAPSHFPSKASRIHISHTDNKGNWQFEHSITSSLDIRDPQFLQFKGTLYLFYMSHRLQLFNHEPAQIYYIKRSEQGWSDPVPLPFQQSGFWNVKAKNGTVYMSLYTRNGEGNKQLKRHFALVASKDLRTWQPVYNSNLTRERLRSYQTSESSFDFDAQGNIFGTIRSLIYPNLNFSIDPDSPADWHMRVDRFKCDGPKLFEHNGKHYLIARRSAFYRLRDEPFRFFNKWRNIINVLRYSLSRKRTALYQFDPKTLHIEHIQDLPSHGDTGYSAIAPIDANNYLLIYYSSPLQKGQDHSWLRGQIAGKTRLYQSIISFAK